MISPSLSPPPSLVPDRLVGAFHSDFTVVSHKSHPALYPHYIYTRWAVNSVVTHLSLPLSPSVLIPDTSDFVCVSWSESPGFLVQSGDLFAVVSQKFTPSPLSCFASCIKGVPLSPPHPSPPPSLVPDRLVCAFHSDFTVVSHKSHPALYPHYTHGGQ